ncbi:hypothetical protein [Oceanobacillus profundus]|uniref:hypothetical protein n=1 Tax=Oceanobacillus profundus TaxID=372463 RepID=UPI0013140455|nr:hypothetical protein [Oceanobacillus profundus]MBR2246099.1 hypothetical protein [Bacilli bacterium]MBR3119770.1 hypothetical protein [Oceanobacillus sp.]
MIVYITPIDYHYFKTGLLSLGYKSKPSFDQEFKKITVLTDEIVDDLGDSRLLLTKRV